MIKSSLEQVEERFKSAKEEKTSLEQTARSLRNELNREKKTKTEFESKITELQSEWGVLDHSTYNYIYTSGFLTARWERGIIHNDQNTIIKPPLLVPHIALRLMPY